MLAKNILLFYILLLIPVATFALAAKYDYIHSGTFAFVLFLYIFLYHPLICGFRLVQSKKINKQDLWKNLIPFWNDKYWAFLFFNK
jgi:hypothetical protein